MPNENERLEFEQAYKALSDSDKAIFNTIINLAVALLKGAAVAAEARRA